MLSTHLIIRIFLSKVENLLFKIGSEYKISQLKAVVPTHYYIVFFDVADTLTVNFLVFMLKTSIELFPS